LVQLRTHRTALILYGVLIVLPTLVLGGLLWHQQIGNYEAEREAIPHKAEDTAARFVDLIHDRVQRLIDGEAERPFADYGSLMITADVSLAEATAVTSPLVSEKRRDAILTWFCFDLRDREMALDLWGGSNSKESVLEAEYGPALRELMKRFLEEGVMIKMFSRWDQPQSVDVSLLQVVFNRLHKRDFDCLQFGQGGLSHLKVTLDVTPFHVQFFLDSKGVPRLVATRRVLLYGPLPELASYGSCFDALAGGMSLIQGFLIDPDWFFRDLPAQLARSVLDSSQRFVPYGGDPCCGGTGEYHAEIRLLADLGFETAAPEERDFRPLKIAVDYQTIESTYSSLRWSFLALAAMLGVSLSTGMWLLLRSVRKDLEQAARTENFVAAVTHELRTPLTSIKMYGEMLLDGDAGPAEKQREYYKRIVRASERLNTLVERVLEKARLSAGSTQAEPGDLNALVAGLQRQLVQYGPEGDLAFELAPEIPEVLLTPEAVVSIVSNLVENARKYAPVDPAQPGAEPILVRTRFENGEVSLEVLDRGPGVPADEAGKVFEAFYRVGTEATRTARGAGLGLHLVMLQARSIGGDAGYRPRPGGGAVFWVHFAPAEA
jgi:signal transduction histidine kinase